MNKPQLTKSELRTQAQRKRILEAAERCFVERGFHAASMANIAETADMSPGLIYRYFAGKDEIILAIIDQQLERVREEMRKLDGSIDLPTEICQLFERSGGKHEHRMNPALFLEMSAEATRDPKIAAAVHASDRTLRADFCEWLGRSREKGGLGVPANKTESVALLLQFLVEGIQVRAVREPDLNREVVQDILMRVLAPLLTPDSAATP